jgi:hypothetical protein
MRVGELQKHEISGRRRLETARAYRVHRGADFGINRAAGAQPQAE